MKYAFAAIALAAVARAQTLADIPSCALPCLDKSIADNTDCETTDLACVCENFDQIQGDATSCVVEECGAEVALNDVLPAAQALCENPPAATTEAAPTTEAAAPTTTAAAVTSAAEEPSAYPEPSSSSVYVSVPEESSAAPTPTTVVVPPTPIPTGGAAALGSVGALAMVVLGAIAL